MGRVDICEEAIGTIDGVNDVFAVSEAMLPGSLLLELNGQMIANATPPHPWTELTTTTFQLDDAPLTGDRLFCYYRRP